MATPTSPHATTSTRPRVLQGLVLATLALAALLAAYAIWDRSPQRTDPNERPAPGVQPIPAGRPPAPDAP